MSTYDLTLPIHNQMITPPGVPPAQIQLDIYGHGTIYLPTELGTHLDAPKLLYPEGQSIDELDLDKLSGPCLVITLPYEANTIEISHLQNKTIPPGSRLLIKTRNSHLLEDQRFYTDHVAFTTESAQFLADRHLSLIGLDYFSIDPFDSPDLPAHQLFLSKQTPILEAIYLESIPPGTYHLTCLPLPLYQAGSAPCRAILQEK